MHMRELAEATDGSVLAREEWRNDFLLPSSRIQKL